MVTVAGAQTTGNELKSSISKAVSDKMLSWRWPRRCSLKLHECRPEKLWRRTGKDKVDWYDWRAAGDGGSRVLILHCHPTQTSLSRRHSVWIWEIRRNRFPSVPLPRSRILLPFIRSNKEGKKTHQHVGQSLRNPAYSRYSQHQNHRPAVTSRN